MRGTTSAATYDGLARTIQEERQYPGTGGVATAGRALGYNALGWMTSTELWNSSQTTNVIHDRFGRVTEIQPPDPSLAPALFRYPGERHIDRSDKVTTEVGTEHYVCTRVYDEAPSTRLAMKMSGLPGTLVSARTPATAKPMRR